MDKLLNTLNQYLSAAHDIVVKYGPQVWASTLSLVRLDGIFNLVALAVGTLIITVFCWKALPVFYKKAGETFDDHHGWVLIAVFGSLGAAIGGVVVLIGWASSLPYWLAVINPQLAVLYHAAQSAGLL